MQNHFFESEHWSNTVLLFIYVLLIDWSEKKIETDEELCLRSMTIFTSAADI